jgi:DNA modification methylase
MTMIPTITTTGQVIDQTIADDYAVYNGDSAEALQGLPENSIDFSVFSPPFGTLYQYNASERDLGNCQSEDEFLQHHSYITNHLLRVTKPGRLVAIHVSQIPAMLVRDGYIGIKDFRGMMIRHGEAHGFIFHGEVAITKNPQVQSIRVHAKGLSFQQLHKDSVWMRPALMDFILLFRKPGENAVPVVPDVDNETWIKWANGVWYGLHDDPIGGISETETLNVAEAREAADDRHVCPLQLSVIERCIRLWSNRGETVLSPFAGIGSEGYVSLQHGRKFIGIELKTRYYQTMLKNLARAQVHQNQMALL